MNEQLQSNNKFSYNYLRFIIDLAKDSGYTFYTLRDYLKSNCPKEKAFLLKHDLDFKPASLKPMLDVELECNVRSTVFVRVAGANYNVLGYDTLHVIREFEQQEFEFGLHSNFLEFATINNIDPYTVLKAEHNMLKNFICVNGMSTHRDLNYAYNSLPWLENNWDFVSNELFISYQAYDERFMKNTIYVNEGYSPHLCWRNHTPENVIKTGKSIYMLIHPHWWWSVHPHEVV